MQNLLDAVKQVKQTIQNHKSELMGNEALTRYALVDVILNALGWDVHNPAKVFPEYNKGMAGGRADYALLDTSGSPVAVVEAKKLGSVSSNDLIQVANYAFNGGIKYSLATDGNTWMVADAYKPVPSPQKEVMRFCLETEPENLLLIKLVSLMPANLCAGNNAFFTPVQSTNIVDNKQTQLPNLSSQPSTSHSQLDASWEPLSKFKEVAKPPTKLKFPDGTVAATDSTYRGTLKQIAEWLTKNQKIVQLPIGDCTKESWYLINTTPIQKNGKPFTREYKLSNGWYLETDFGRNYSVKNSLWLIKKAGENPEHFYFQ